MNNNEKQPLNPPNIEALKSIQDHIDLVNSDSDQKTETEKLTALREIALSDWTAKLELAGAPIVIVVPIDNNGGRYYVNGKNTYVLIESEIKAQTRKIIHPNESILKQIEENNAGQYISGTAEQIFISPVKYKDEAFVIFQEPLVNSTTPIAWTTNEPTETSLQEINKLRLTVLNDWLLTKSEIVAIDIDNGLYGVDDVLTYVLEHGEIKEIIKKRFCETPYWLNQQVFTDQNYYASRNPMESFIGMKYLNEQNIKLLFEKFNQFIDDVLNSDDVMLYIGRDTKLECRYSTNTSNLKFIIFQEKNNIHMLAQKTQEQQKTDVLHAYQQSLHETGQGVCTATLGDGNYLINDKKTYILTPTEIKQCVSDFMATRIHQVDRDFIINHSKFLKLAIKDDPNNDPDNETRIKRRLEIITENALKRAPEEQYFWNAMMRSLIDDYDCFLKDLLNEDGEATYVGENTKIVYRQEIDDQEFVVFEEQPTPKMEPHIDCDTIITELQTPYKIDNSIIIEAESNNGRCDLVVTTKITERELVRQTIFEQLHLIEDEYLIKHSTFLSGCNDAAAEAILTALKDSDDLYLDGLTAMIDDTEGLVDTLVAIHNLEYYVGNENSTRMETEMGVVIYHSPVQ